MEFLAEAIRTASSLSTADYISIISTYTAMTDLTFNCHTCKKKYPRDPDRQKKHQTRSGCFNEFPDPILKYSGANKTPMFGTPNINYFKCPAQLYSHYWSSIINLEKDFSEGRMPYEGSYLDQPSLIVEAFNLIHNLKEETNIKQQQVLDKYGKRSKR